MFWLAHDESGRLVLPPAIHPFSQFLHIKVKHLVLLVGHHLLQHDGPRAVVHGSCSGGKAVSGKSYLAF